MLDLSARPAEIAEVGNASRIPAVAAAQPCRPRPRASPKELKARRYEPVCRRRSHTPWRKVVGGRVACRTGGRGMPEVRDRSGRTVIAGGGKTPPGPRSQRAARGARSPSHPALPGAVQQPADLFLLAAAAAAWALGHRLDATVILAVVTINAVVGFLQEAKAEKALSAIRRMISPRASLRRDGRRTSVAVADLVPGRCRARSRRATGCPLTCACCARAHC